MDGQKIKPKLKPTPKAKVLVVEYTTEYVYCLPKNINLEDKTQVERWHIKDEELCIHLINGKNIKIDEYGYSRELEHKYPENDKIVDAKDYVDLDEDSEEFAPINLEPEPLD